MVGLDAAGLSAALVLFDPAAAVGVASGSAGGEGGRSSATGEETEIISSESERILFSFGFDS